MIQHIIVGALVVGALVYLVMRFKSTFQKDGCESSCGCAAAEINQNKKVKS